MTQQPRDLNGLSAPVKLRPDTRARLKARSKTYRSFTPLDQVVWDLLDLVEKFEAAAKAP
jgi:hypothetical protein